MFFFYIFNVMVQTIFRCEGKMMKDVFWLDEIHFFPQKELQSLGISQWNQPRAATWMSQEVSKWLVNGL